MSAFFLPTSSLSNLLSALYEYFLYYFDSYLCCHYEILLNIHMYNHSMKLDPGFSPQFIELAADVFQQVCKKDIVFISVFAQYHCLL